MEDLEARDRELRNGVGSKVTALDVVAHLVDGLVGTREGHGQLGRQGFVRITLDEDQLSMKVHILSGLGDGSATGGSDLSVGPTRKLRETLKVGIEEA